MADCRRPRQTFFRFGWCLDEITLWLLVLMALSLKVSMAARLGHLGWTELIIHLGCTYTASVNKVSAYWLQASKVFVALSMDDGQSFETIETPYEGSFFYCSACLSKME